MRKKIGDINDYIKANRKASRDEEIAAHGKQISMRCVVHTSKKKYNRNSDKKQAKKDLLLLFIAAAT